MPANLQKIMSEVPRPLEIAAKDYAHEGRRDRKKLPKAEVARRLEPLIGLIASGEIPLDEHAAKAISTYIEEHHARASKSQ